MEALSLSERDLWRKFRAVAEQINVAVDRDLIATTQLSGADHGILSRIAETEPKSMRQQKLCDLMRWDRTRLSHHLTRMEKRGLVKRSKLENGGSLVTITTQGDSARIAADPVHAESVRRHFLLKLTAAQRDVIASFAKSAFQAKST